MVISMWLKVLIVILFIGNIAALTRAFYTLMVNHGTGSKQTANILAIRVTLGVLLILVVSYGIWSGELAISAPWHNPQGL